MSIRPRFARSILAGEKTVELRRRAPHLGRGDVVVVYETSPTKAIVGWATVEKVETTTPAALWKRVHGKAGVNRREYDEYFAGTASATAIHFSRVSVLTNPIVLSDMRARWPWLRPPQSYRYVSVTRSAAAIERIAPAGM